MRQMDTKTIKMASVLWDYMSSYNQAALSDALVVCCSYDLRVCDHACDLIKQGISDTLILSGNTGNWTRHIWSSAEAQIFKKRALKNGIDESRVIVEQEATNFGENVSCSRKLFPLAKTVTFVTKPNAVLRVKLTAEAQWPGIASYVSCPSIVFPQDVSNVVGVLGVINEMIGDIERIQKYPELGFQVPHELPGEVLDAWSYLIGQGFTGHLMQPD